MRSCLRFAPMVGSREGELSAEESRELAAHLAQCESCSALAAEVAATAGLLSEALLAKANARDFGPFVDEVMGRVGRDAPSPGRARGPGLSLAFLRAHWKLFTASAAAVVAAASLFLYVRLDVEPEPEQLASLEVDLEGGNTVLQTSDGPVVLLEPDDSGS